MADKEIDGDEVSKAFKVIKQAMKDDDPEIRGSYAHGWHCNIAMAMNDTLVEADIVDEFCIDQIHAVCNDAASRFMRLCFDVGTKQ